MCTRLYPHSHQPTTPRQVSSQLNAIYLDYCATHPDFSGQVSLFAHSLGSVICFDLISHQHLAQHRGVDSQPSAADAPSARVRASPEAGDTSRRGGARGDARGEGVGPFALRWPPLAFDACNLFMLGSPLAMFLRLREATGERDEVHTASHAHHMHMRCRMQCIQTTHHTSPPRHRRRRRRRRPHRSSSPRRCGPRRAASSTSSTLRTLLPSSSSQPSCARPSRPRPRSMEMSSSRRARPRPAVAAAATV